MDQRLVNDAMRLPGMGIWGISAYERRVGVVPACGAGILGVPSRQCPCAWLSRRRGLNRFLHRPWCNLGPELVDVSTSATANHEWASSLRVVRCLPV